MPAALAKAYGGAVDEKRMEELASYIRPCRDKVLIYPSEQPKEVSGIIVPDAARKEPTEGVVISCGPDVRMVHRLGDDGLPEKDEHGQEILDPEYARGERVVYGRYSGTAITFPDGLVLLLVPDCDIQGILNPDCPMLDRNKKKTFLPT